MTCSQLLSYLSPGQLEQNIQPHVKLCLKPRPCTTCMLYQSSHQANPALTQIRLRFLGTLICMEASQTPCVTGCHQGLQLCWLQMFSLPDPRPMERHSRPAKQSRQHRRASLRLQARRMDSRQSMARLLNYHHRPTSLVHPQQHLDNSSNRMSSLMSVLQANRML